MCRSIRGQKRCQEPFNGHVPLFGSPHLFLSVRHHALVASRFSQLIDRICFILMAICGVHQRGVSSNMASGVNQSFALARAVRELIAELWPTAGWIRLEG